MREPGRIVALEPHCVWVQTQRQTTCANCSAKPGCASHLLQRLHPAAEQNLQIPVSASQRAELSIGDLVELEVSDNMVLKAAGLVYLVPLLGLFAGGLLAQWWFGSDGAVALLGAAGFAVGIYMVSRYQQAVAGTSALRLHKCQSIISVPPTP